MAFCSVCAVKYEKGGDLSLHGFPTNPETRKKWNAALHCDDSILPRSYRVCSNHFTPESFDCNGCSSKKTLKKDAVPTIFKRSDSLPPSAILQHAKRKRVLEAKTNGGLLERRPTSRRLIDQSSERSASKIERMVMSARHSKYQLLMRKLLNQKNNQNKILKQCKQMMDQRFNNQKKLLEVLKSTQLSSSASLEAQRTEDTDNVKSKNKCDNSAVEESVSDLKAGPSFQVPEPLPQTTITNELLLSFIEHLKRPPIQDDRYDIIGKSVAMKLRNLPKKKMFITERKINDILFEAEVGSVNRSGVSETLHQQEASSSGVNYGNTSTIPILTAFGLLVNPSPSTTNQQDTCPQSDPTNNIGKTVPNVNVYSRTSTSQSMKSTPSPSIPSEDVQYNVRCKEEPYD